MSLYRQQVASVGEVVEEGPDMGPGVQGQP